MKSNSTHQPAAAALAAAIALAALAGCTSVGDGFFSGDKVDYRNTATKTKPLDVPPDLTQLARDSRYQSQGGVVSAAAAGAPVAPGAPGAAASAAAAQPQAVALNALGGLRVEREGQQRWLVVPMTPEQLWPQLKGFWEQRGFTLSEENAQAGVMETNWSENKAKQPDDAVRNLLGRLGGNLYDTGERDRFRTRVERTAAGSEIYIAHRGIEEVYINERKDGTTWRPRANDPQLEAELLARLMVNLTSRDDTSRLAVASASAVVAAASAPGGVPRTQTGTATSLVVDEPFDRAWRRVGLALDRSGFTVEDRDRAGGLYYVRYVDPKNIGKEDPSWWAKLWGDKSNPQEALRYRVALKTTDNKTTVSVQNSAGAAEVGDNARRIVGFLANELR